jgi:hypothetical protein
VLPFLLTLDEHQQLVYLRHELVVAAENFASVVDAYFRAIDQAMGFGQGIDRFWRKIISL